MRRSATMAAGALVLIASANAPATAQEGIGLSIRPPEEVHPAPPAPPVPDPSPAPSPGPSFAIGPAAGLAGRPSPAIPDLGLDPPRVGPPADVAGPGPVATPGVVIRPASREARPIGEFEGALLPRSPTIAPPLLDGPEDGPRANPLLPPASSGRGGSPRSGTARDGAPPRDRPPIAEPIRPDRGRPGLLGGMLDRLAGRAPAPPARPRGAGPASGIDPDDPLAVEGLRRALERQIVARERDRLASVEILVVGRRVHIRAEAGRPWQRRALRRGLEELRMPDGFLSTVDVR